MLSYIGSLLFWTFFVLSSILLFPGAVIIKLFTFSFDRRLVILHLFSSFWASLYTWLNPCWMVTISGREKIRSNEVYIMVSNHQSSVDILVLFRLFIHFKWVSKTENFKMPLIGWNMFLNRYIMLKRGSIKGNRKMIKDCQSALKEGNSILIFPEGTRSESGQLRSFKPGAFDLALRSKRPILPIVLNGSAQALHKGGFRLMGKHQISIQVLDEIPYANVVEYNSKALMTQVFGLMEKELKKMQIEA